jgi:cyclopropane fatty-acyl-phospholipid synthase-like methyltransferase
MRDFYEPYYAAVETSRAHHLFCERVFGIDLAQHGFADRKQLSLLIRATRLRAGQRALDLGCGDGRISEYLSDRTGARITGLDYIEAAIHNASQRTAAKSDRLDFLCQDINQLALPRGAFDLVISIDSIYFSEKYENTIRELKAALRPGGQMAFFYSYGREPWVPKEKFPAEMLASEKTPLGVSLQANDLAFRTWDLTGQEYRLALVRKHVLAELKPQFEAEGNMFIWDNRNGDADGVRQAVEEGLHRRYLYLARVPDSR